MENPTEQTVRYAAYPRGPRQYGSAEHLQAVSDIYYGSGNAGALTVISSTLTLLAVATAGGNPLLWLAINVPVMGVLTALANKKAIERMTIFGWPPTTATAVWIICGLTASFCIGALPLAMIQSKSYRELRRYGLGRSFLGVTKKQIAGKIQELQADPQPPYLYHGPEVHLNPPA